MAFPLEIGVFFIDFGAVLQDDLGDVRRGPRAVDRAVEALRDETRQEAAMVQMGVRQNDGVQFRGRKFEIRPVAFLQVVFLIKAAIDENVFAVGLQEVLRTGYVLRGSEEAEMELHGRFLLLMVMDAGRRGSLRGRRRARSRAP